MSDQLFLNAARALAAIDKELGMPEDGCNSTQATLNAIRLLKSAHRDDVAEIERLAAELAAARESLRMLTIESAHKANLLQAELSAARADAERYRWLRSFAGRTSELPDFDEPKSPEHMDAMIDAARTAPSAGGPQS